MFNLVFTRTPQVLFCQAFFQLSSPQHVLVPWVVLLQVQACISPSWTPWGSCHPISAVWWGPSGWQHLAATPPGFVSSSNLLRAQSSPSLTKISNRTGPSIGLWLTLMVTGLQFHATDRHPLGPPTQFIILLTVCSSNPYCISLSGRILWETLLESRLATSSAFPSSTKPDISSQKFTKMVKQGLLLHSQQC